MIDGYKVVYEVVRFVSEIKLRLTKYAISPQYKLGVVQKKKKDNQYIRNLHIVRITEAQALHLSPFLLYIVTYITSNQWFTNHYQS